MLNCSTVPIEQMGWFNPKGVKVPTYVDEKYDIEQETASLALDFCQDFDPRRFLVSAEPKLPGDVWTAGYLMTLPFSEPPDSCSENPQVPRPSRMYMDRHNFRMFCERFPNAVGHLEEIRTSSLFVPIPRIPDPPVSEKEADQVEMVEHEVGLQRSAASVVVEECPSDFRMLRSGTLLHVSQLSHSFDYEFAGQTATSMVLNELTKSARNERRSKR